VGCVDSFKIIVKFKAEKNISERKSFKNSTTKNIKGKEKLVVTN